MPLSPQIVLDTPLLLALRPADDNPWAPAARAFVRRMEERIADLALVAWLPLSVVQECYHVILAGKGCKAVMWGV